MAEWLSHCCTWSAPPVWASQARQDSDESMVEEALSLQGQSTRDSENTQQSVRSRVFCAGATAEIQGRRGGRMGLVQEGTWAHSEGQGTV